MIQIIKNRVWINLAESKSVKTMLKWLLGIEIFHTVILSTYFE